MAQMLTIPYARQQAYRNPEYVRAMSELMLRRGDTASAAALMKGQNTQQLMQSLGALTMGTFAGIGKQRDEERDRAMLQAERDREYALRQQEMTTAADERRLAREEREEQKRELNAREVAENVPVGAGIPLSEYEALRGTTAAKRFQPMSAMAARLPATPMADTMGYLGNTPLVAPSPTPGVTTPLDSAGGDEQDYLRPVRRTMSTDTAARPAQAVRTPSQAEALNIRTQERLEQDAIERQANTRTDNDRQMKALELQLENIRADNKRGDLALENAAEARRNSLEMRRFMAEAARDQRQLSNMFTLSGQVKSHPAYSKMLDFESGLQAVETGLKQGNGLGDIAAINAFQRLVDPGVSVREGDVRLLESAIALGAKLNPAFWMDKLAKGDRLPEPMRLQMQQAARDLYVARTNTYNETVGDTFRKQADAARIPFSLIGRDFQIPDFGKAAAPGGKPTSPFNDPNAQPGKKP